MGTNTVPEALKRHANGQKTKDLRCTTEQAEMTCQMKEVGPLTTTSRFLRCTKIKQTPADPTHGSHVAILATN